MALLERIGIGRHEGYDRVVFQFKNDLPGYRVEYVERPLKEDGRQAGLCRWQRDRRRAHGAGFGLRPEHRRGSHGLQRPKRIEGASAGTSAVQELVRTGDFEAVLSWAIGSRTRSIFGSPLQLHQRG